LSHPHLRIVLFTVNDLEFEPELLEPVLERWGRSVVRVYVSRSVFDFRFLCKRAAALLKEGYPFCIRPADLAGFAIMKAWSGHARKRGAKSMVEFLRKKGFEADCIDEIESPVTLARLRGHQADIFLFATFDKIAKGEFLSIPRLGTFNTHMGKLPEHRGGLSAFWVLRLQRRGDGPPGHRKAGCG
jgi:hypothetical protein